VAALIDRRFTALNSDGADFLPPTASPAKAGLVPGYILGSGSRELVLADPGQLDATVNLKLVTKSGTFAPSGVNQVVVHQQHTLVVDLTKVFGAQTGAVAGDCGGASGDAFGEGISWGEASASTGANTRSMRSQAKSCIARSSFAAMRDRLL